MQILAGDIESAIKSHLVFWNLWRRYSAIPESWSWEDRKVVWTGWPGRPEYIEATYYLYKVGVLREAGINAHVRLRKIRFISKLENEYWRIYNGGSRLLVGSLR